MILAAEPDTGPPASQPLLERYSGDYTIVTEASLADGMARLRSLTDEHQEVALVVADRGSGGVELLRTAKALHPRARRGLLIGWNETRSHREEIAAAFATRDADCLVPKPVVTPDERFHRSITELLDEWWRTRGRVDGVLRVVGSDASPRAHEIRDLLQRYDFAYSFDLDTSAAGAAILAEANVDAAGQAVVVLPDGRTLIDPSNVAIADALGARTRPGSGVYDVVVVGGGPAGLSAAMYAASEGLRTGLIEPLAVGGQAGTSSMIRNYLGFPRGVSGAELAARAFEQAILFGADFVYGSPVTALHTEGGLKTLTLASGDQIRCKTVVVATGVVYRTIDIPTLSPFVGTGVFYGAAMAEAGSLDGHDVVVVGGGNSAAQAAVHLAKFARQVSCLVRGPSLAESMSDYLVTELASTSNIEVLYGVEVVGGGGDNGLEWVDIRDRTTGAESRRTAAALFVLIGAAPRTGWLPASVARDAWGYVHTGPSDTDPSRRPFETTSPGIFAVGDVRHDSIKRVAAAVGEAAVCMRLVHDYLQRWPAA